MSTLPASKKAQSPFGLIGKKLAHSFSPEIHRLLGSFPYRCYELNEDEVETFLHQENWQGLNVTIPYKQLAAQLADSCSDAVTYLGAANTLIKNSAGEIYADNTDVYGFYQLLEQFAQQHHGLSIQQLLDSSTSAKVAILGTGGASKAVRFVLEKLGAIPLLVSRHAEDAAHAEGAPHTTAQLLTYEELSQKHPDLCLIVNTTPVGMYPHCPKSPLSDEIISAFHELKGIVDIVYNPAITQLGFQAQRHGLAYSSGLLMLVAQAYASNRLFLSQEVPETEQELTKNAVSTIHTITKKLEAQTQNIVLIGMPGSGKTSIGKALQKLPEFSDRTFIDLDLAFEERFGLSPAKMIQQNGEAAFRQRETEVTADLAKQSSCIIACGGGIVTRAENYPLLKQQGCIVRIERSLQELSREGRPLSGHNLEDLAQLAQTREEAYSRWSDMTIKNDSSPEAAAQRIAQLWKSRFS